MAGFQRSVNIQPALGLPGDFADANPRWNFAAIGQGLVTGPAGCVAGRFAWIDASGTYASNSGAGAPAGMVHRELQALITVYLAETVQLIPAGFEVTVFQGGSFWVINSGANAVTIGQKAYANYADGSVTFGPPGTAPVGSTTTGAVTAGSASVTGSIAGNVMNVTAVTSGVLYNGGILSGSGVTAGSTITGQLSGTVGGIGTYTVSVQQTVASTTITEAYGLLTVTATSAGVLAVGNVLTGTGVAAGTYVAQFITGTGGNGTYVVSSATPVASTTLTAASAYETKWVSALPAGPGEMVIMTTHITG
jgi:hypothetical protein